MANFHTQYHIRKRVNTYGKTRRKITPGPVFNSASRETTIKHVSQNATEVIGNSQGISLSIDSSQDNSLKIDDSPTTPKDIYDISSDESWNGRISPVYKKSHPQQDKSPSRMNRNDMKNRSSLLSETVQEKQISEKLSKSQRRPSTQKVFELANIIYKTNEGKEQDGARQFLRPFRTKPHNQIEMDINDQRGIAEKHNNQNASDNHKTEKDLPSLKRKHNAVSLKTRMHEKSLKSSVTVNFLKKDETDIFNMCVSDDETTILSSAPVKFSKDIDSYLEETSNLNVITERGIKKTRMSESLMSNREDIYMERNSPMEDQFGQEINNCDLVSSPLDELTEKRKRLHNKDKETNATSEIKESKSRFPCLVDYPDVMQPPKKRIPSKNYSEWEEFIDSANNEENDTSEDSSADFPNQIVLPYPKPGTNSLKPTSLQPMNSIDHFKQNPHRHRMIDSLAQRTKDYSSSDKNIMEEIKSEQRNAFPLDSFPSSSKSNDPNIEHESLSSQVMVSESQSSITSKGIRPKLTYSRQRSMLVEEDLLKELALDLPSQSPTCNKRNRIGSVPKLKSHSVFNEEEDDGDDQVVIRSVHELRKSGAIKRFVDECTDLFDRIGSPGEANSVRRSGLLDLASKMSDSTFIQQFGANSMEQQLFVDFDKEKDVISGFLIISIVLAVLMESHMAHLAPLLCRNGITKLILHLLDYELDVPTICKDYKTKMSKIAQSLVIEHHNLLLKSSTWDTQELKILSPRTTALKCLEKMCHQLRNTEISCKLFSEELISKLFAMMKSISSEKLSTSEINGATDLYLIVACLQAHYITTCNILDEPIWIKEYLPTIADVLESTLPRADDLYDAHIEILKITLQVTNNNQIATEVFVRPSLILTFSKKIVNQFQIISGNLTEDQFSRNLDHLCLLLGILLNFSEWSQRVAECFKGFERNNEKDPLEEMIIIFEERSDKISRAESEQESLQNVVLGYLSVTLAFLSLYPPMGQRLQAHKKKLISCIEEFILIHKLADGKLVKDIDDDTQIVEEDTINEAHRELTERLESLVKRLKS